VLLNIAIDSVTLETDRVSPNYQG